jgi:hypothetical protein
LGRADISSREADKTDAEEGKKKKGGISIPEEWPWEEAKMVFQKPDVTPADELQVRDEFVLLLFIQNIDILFMGSWNGQILTWKDWSNFWSQTRASGTYSVLVFFFVKFIDVHNAYSDHLAKNESGKVLKSCQSI